MSELNTIVKSSIAGNAIDVKDNFKVVVNNKLRDMIDDKRRQVASDFFKTQ